MGNCVLCEYWKIKRAENVHDTACGGECRRNAPVVGKEKWPLTAYSDGRGRFRLREEVSEVVNWARGVPL